MANHPQPLRRLLEKAQAEGYAVGAFNCRYPQMIQAVLDAAQEAASPVCLEIAQGEIFKFRIDLREFAAEAARVVAERNITVPYALHLDHSWEQSYFDQAFAAGFTSVMIDASSKPLEENIRLTREMTAMAHPRGISVEAELGKIASADTLESDNDSTLYTDPEEAARFVRETNCDSLAVSIGSAHGVYTVKDPKIDFDRLREIREKVSIPLVLHGGTGIPEESVKKAIRVVGGGISKLNIATELELNLLATLGVEERLSPEAISALSPEDSERIRQGLRPLLLSKMRDFLGSAGKA